MRSIVAVIFAFGLFLSGCASDEAARYYATERYPARPAKEVEVLHAAPTRPHQVIADFQARNASVEAMRKKAAEIGADAVIVTILGGYRSTSEEWAGEDRYSTSYSRITATAIRYK